MFTHWGRSSSSCSPGRPPFRAETMLETLRMIREQEPVRPEALNPRIDVDLETIVLKCLEKSPGRRYHSAEALADDLERWLADLPIRARPATLPHRAIKWARRRPAAAGLVLMASVATALAIGGIVFTSRLKSDVAKTGLALLEEKEKRREYRERSWSNRANASSGWKRISTSRRSLPPTRLLRRTTRFEAERLLADCPPRLRNWEWRHLNRRLHPELLTIQGHSGLVCPDFRPDTTSAECRTDALSGPIWDAAGGPKLRRMHGPDGTAYGVALDRAGLRMATAGSDGQVKVWDMTRGRLLHVFRGHEGWTAGVAFSPDGTQARLGRTGWNGPDLGCQPAPRRRAGRETRPPRSCAATRAEFLASRSVPMGPSSPRPAKTGPPASGT